MSLPIITPTEAKRLMTQGATLVDIRERDEHAREYIAGARNVPLTALDGLTGVTAPVIFHCRAGKRTADNAERLRQAARCEAYIVEGGIEGWKQAGLPVVLDKSRPIELNRQVMIAAGGLVLAGVLLGAVVDSAFYAFSGLIGAGLVFAGVSGFCGLAKLLALMPWNRVPAKA
ncbi:rhodanese family protein [Methyloceanibacter sp.]|uniref:rhodanese family protein n=1 Tax=Methyloceanibacter sp. TaxID=1965321 RepID=UPI002D403C6B|nr:rhodanese family protein [Methyloceanibacter sp.]HZP08481.1 rhodanese family protein [Methyloceanibacter sp.]